MMQPVKLSILYAGIERPSVFHADTSEGIAASYAFINEFESGKKRLKLCINDTNYIFNSDNICEAFVEYWDKEGDDWYDAE